MDKIKELLFWRFSLFAGLLALASIFVLSYFYYRVQTNTPFVYWQVISNLSEYRVLDSRVNVFDKDGSIDVVSLRDNLLMQRDLIETTLQSFYLLREKNIEIPPETELNEIRQSIAYRNSWLNSCEENNHCDVALWVRHRYKAWEACEKLLAGFNVIIYEKETLWSENLRFFYILSVILLLSTLFFAAGRSRGYI